MYKNGHDYTIKSVSKDASMLQKLTAQDGILRTKMCPVLEGERGILNPKSNGIHFYPQNVWHISKKPIW